MINKLFFAGIIALFFLGCDNKNVQKDNHVIVRAIKDVETLNPISYGGMVESHIIFDLIYQSLLTIDMEDGEVKPLLAASHPKIQIKDSLSFFTYEIRDEAKWPNGTPVTSEDVLFTLKLANCPLISNDYPRRNLAFIQNFISDTSSLKKFTLVCNGYGEDMNIMTGDFSILPKYVYDSSQLLSGFELAQFKNDFEDLKSQPDIQEFAKIFNNLSASHEPADYVGSGGYELNSWETDRFITLKKKEDWWADKLNISHMTANPEQISYQIIPDDASATLALKNGQLDVMVDIPVKEFQQLSRDSSFTNHYDLFSPFTYTVYYIGINGRSPKFQGKKTRQALAHLIDVEGLISSIGQSPSSRANSLISPNDKKNHNASIKAFDFNAETAKKLLTEDGWHFENNAWFKDISGRKEQLTASVQYKAGKNEYEIIALLLRQEAEKIGIPISINPLENSVISNNLKQHNFDLYIRSLIGNPFAFNFTPLLHTKSSVINGMNYTAFGNPESDKLIESIITEKDKDMQALQIKELQEIMHEEANLVFLYFNEQKMAVHKRFTNLKISGFYPNYDVSAFKLNK